MKSFLAKISLEISQQKQEAHIVQFKINSLNARLIQAVKNDPLHTKRLSEN